VAVPLALALAGGLVLIALHAFHSRGLCDSPRRLAAEERARRRVAIEHNGAAPSGLVEGSKVGLGGPRSGLFPFGRAQNIEDKAAARASSDCKLYVYDTVPTTAGDFLRGGQSAVRVKAPDPEPMPAGRKGFTRNLHHHLGYYFHKRALEDPRRVSDPTNATVFFVDFSQVTEDWRGLNVTFYDRLSAALKAENSRFGPATYAAHSWVRYRPTMSLLKPGNVEYVGWQRLAIKFTHGLASLGELGSIVERNFRTARARDLSPAGVDRVPNPRSMTKRFVLPPLTVLREWVAVPYASIFNGWRGMRRGDLPMVAALQNKRPLLAAGVWAPRRAVESHAYTADNPHSGTQREVLARMCGDRLKLCRIVNMKENKHRKGQYNIADLVELMEHTVFMLQPIGDCFTRKASFDAMAVGAIPVVFDPRSFDMMWHAPNPEEFAVVIEPNLWNVSSTENIIDVLDRIPPARIARLQRNIAAAGMRFHYAADRASCGAAPCHDAYAVAMENLCQRGRNTAAMQV